MTDAIFFQESSVIPASRFTGSVNAPLVREIQTIIQTLPLPRFVFALYFLYKTKRGIYYIHMKQIYGLYRSSLYSNILVYDTDLWVVEVITLQLDTCI